MSIATSKQRMSMSEVYPEAYRAVLGLEQVNRSGPLEPSLYELVKIRASQINGCAYCLNMHNRDARAAGESQQRLDVLRAWREVDGLYTDRERAALALTEAVTLISVDGVPDDVWTAVRESFDERETSALIVAIALLFAFARSREAKSA